MNRVQTPSSSTSSKQRIKVGIFMLIMAVFFVGIQIYFNALLGWHANHYAELSKSFLQGELSFSEKYVQQVGAWDMTHYKGEYYWPLGPFPAVALMPVVALSDVIPLQTAQSVVNVLFALAAVYASYRIARKIGYGENDSIFWAVAFSLGSTAIGVTTFSSSWYLAHTIAVSLVLLALWEYLGKRRPWLIGILMAVVAASRATAGLGIIFFAIAYLFGQSIWKVKAKKLALLLFPFLICVMLLSYYNLVRYDSFTYTGYEQQQIPDAVVVENRATKGMFSVEHLPRNIYFLLFGTPKLMEVLNDAEGTITLPVFDPRGMSIFLTTPWLLAAFMVAYRRPIMWQLLISAGFIAGVILLWHSTGCVQWGSRLALDFLPYVILAFMMAYFEKQGRLSSKMKTVIILAAILNICLVLTSIFNIPNETTCSL